MEEKDGGEKVRLGMVVCLSLYLECIKEQYLTVKIGHSRKLRGDARGFGEDRWW